MARIKTFKGTGPNPNVPFSNVPDARSVGLQERAVQGLANNIQKQAVDYAKAQKRQEDSAALAEFSAAKIKARDQSRLANFDPSTNTYNTEKIEKDLSDFDASIKSNTNDEVYNSYNNRQTLLNANEIARLNNENLKATRQNNRNAVLNSLEVMSESALTGTFEDMMINANEIRETTVGSVEAGTFTPLEGKDAIDKTLSGLAKTYIDTTTKVSSTNLSQIKESFDKASLFVEKDPLGVFKNNDLLKQQSLATIANKRFRATQAAIRIANQKERQFQSRVNKEQLANYNNYLEALRNYTDEGDFEEGYEGAFAGISRAQLKIQAEEDYRENKINQRQYQNVITYNAKMSKVADDSLLEEIAANPAQAEQLVPLLKTRTGLSKAQKFLEVKIPSFYKENIKKTIKDTPGINKLEYYSEVSSRLPNFQKATQSDKESKFSHEDLDIMVLIDQGHIFTYDGKIKNFRALAKYKRHLAKIGFPSASNAFIQQRLERLDSLMSEGNEDGR